MKKCNIDICVILDVDSMFGLYDRVSEFVRKFPVRLAYYWEKNYDYTVTKVRMRFSYLRSNGPFSVCVDDSAPFSDCKTAVENLDMYTGFLKREDTLHFPSESHALVAVAKSLAYDWEKTEEEARHIVIVITRKSVSQLLNAKDCGFSEEVEDVHDAINRAWDLGEGLNVRIDGEGKRLVIFSPASEWQNVQTFYDHCKWFGDSVKQEELYDFIIE